MTAPRLREQRRPPSPPDRRSPRRGGGSSPYSYAVSAGGPRALAAAACFSVVCALALPATAEAQSLHGDDLPVLEFTKSTVAIEDAGHANVFLKLDRAASVPIKVHWETSELSPATAVAGVDYWPGPGTVTFAPGDMEEQFRVMLRNDDRVEDTEKFLVIIRPANPALVTVPEYEREYTIIDTDDLKLTIDVETVVREAARVAHVRVYAEEVPLDFDFNFQYETQPGTVVPEGLQGNNAYTAYVAEAAGLTYAAATEGRDYRHTTGTLTFGPGRLRHTITVPIINDGAEEEPELFQIWMQRVKETDRRIRGPGRAARVVIDRSDYPLVSLWDAEGVEGEDMVFTVALSKATGADVTVDWTVDFWRGSTADAADFETMSGTATVAAGSREATFTVATADDTADEEDETFLVRLSNFSWNSQIGDPTATGVITDNDVSPFASRYTITRVMQVDVRKPGGAAWAAGEKVRVRVRFTGPPQPYTPDTPPEERLNWDKVDVAGGTPTIDLLLGDRERRTLARTASYVGGSGTNTLVFEYEVTGGDGRVGAVEVEADSLASNGATIRNEPGYDAELDHLSAVRYAQRPALSVADAEATEGEDATLDFVVKLDGNSGSEVKVDYRTRDETAEAGSDYTETRGGLTFAPGEYEKTVSVPIRDDAVEDDGETFKLLLSNVSGAGVANDDYEAVGTIRNSETTARPDLTASFVGVPAAHDGESAFTFRVAFSKDIGISFRSLRKDAFTVTGGRVTRGRRVDGRRDLFEMTVEPDGDGEVTITLPAGRECAVSGAICTNGKNRRQLTNSPSATVAGPPVEPLTASFEGMPAEHRGEGGFHFRVAFSEDIGISFRSLREDAFTVTGGRVTGGKRVDGRRDLFRMTVRPESDAAVTITLPAGRECGVSGAICTKGEPRRQLTNNPSATVAGPVGIAVADARVEEGAGAVLAFAVTLSRAASGTLTVDYATSDGTATAGTDYTAVSGTLTFTAGESSKTIEVTVLDDSHDEGEETLTLRLSDPSGGRVTDGEATGTIENRDPMPKAFMARFGRTAAVHVVEQVQERIEARREPGIEARFGGREVGRELVGDLAVGFLSRLGSSTGAHGDRAGAHGPVADWPVAGTGLIGAPRGSADGLVGRADPMGSMPGTDEGLNQRGHFGRGLGGGNLLTGSSFVMNHETRRGGILSFWSRGAQSRFAGREGELSLDGRVRNTIEAELGGKC